jgi:hypothetical protein
MEGIRSRKNMINTFWLIWLDDDEFWNLILKWASMNATSKKEVDQNFNGLLERGSTPEKIIELQKEIIIHLKNEYSVLYVIAQDLHSQLEELLPKEQVDAYRRYKRPDLIKDPKDRFKVINCQ